MKRDKVSSRTPAVMRPLPNVNVAGSQLGDRAVLELGRAVPERTKTDVFDVAVRGANALPYVRAPLPIRHPSGTTVAAAALVLGGLPGKRLERSS